MPDMMDIFGEQGLFARHVPGFAHRPGQLEMALAVERLLAATEPSAGQRWLHKSQHGLLPRG